jgi:hypothetical protein
MNSFILNLDIHNIRQIEAFHTALVTNTNQLRIIIRLIEMTGANHFYQI